MRAPILRRRQRRQRRRGSDITPLDSPVTVTPRPQRLIPHLARRLFGLSLFYKVLIANSALIVLGALAGTAITLHVATLRSIG